MTSSLLQCKTLHNKRDITNNETNYHMYYKTLTAKNLIKVDKLRVHEILASKTLTNM